MATDNKYDRQLRLWGPDGQKRLSQSCTILFNATSAGTESLKNLVLPGIGSFHIVDVEEEGGSSEEPFTNFFVFPPLTAEDESPPSSSKGNDGRWSRAEIAVRNLKELNPDVVGGHTTLPSFSHLFQDQSSSQESSQQPSHDSNGDDDATQSVEDKIHKLLTKIKTEHSTECWSDVTILAADLPPAYLRPLADFCWTGHTPSTANPSERCPPIGLVAVRSYGLLGTVRAQVRDHRVIVDSKPDNTVADLRLLDCWLGTEDAQAARAGGGFPELRELADQTDMGTLDDRDHGHVPFVVLLLKALDRWWEQEQSNSPANADSSTTVPQRRRPPKTIQEKKAFRAIIRSMSRNLDREMNFQEAHNDAYLAYTKLELDEDTLGRLRSSTMHSLRDKITGAGGTKIQAIDLLLHSLKIFMLQTADGSNADLEGAGEFKGEGPTPVNGSVPDMASSTGGFVRIQTLYKDRAERDRKKMRQILDRVLAELYPIPSEEQVVVTDDELSKFTRNVHCLRYLRTRRWTDEYDLTYPSSSSNDDDQDIRENLLATTYDPYEDKYQTPLLWYIAIRACDAFHDQEGIYPGSDGRDLALKSDAVVVHNHICDIVRRMGLQPDDDDDEGLIRSTILKIDGNNDDDATTGRSGKYAKEIVRYHNAEIHNVASVVGGVASQEVVKLITGQYVPMEGTYVFNGLASVAGVYKV